MPAIGWLSTRDLLAHSADLRWGQDGGKAPLAKKNLAIIGAQSKGFKEDLGKYGNKEFGDLQVHFYQKINELEGPTSRLE